MFLRNFAGWNEGQIGMVYRDFGDLKQIFNFISTPVDKVYQ